MEEVTFKSILAKLEELYYLSPEEHDEEISRIVAFELDGILYEIATSNLSVYERVALVHLHIEVGSEYLTKRQKKDSINYMFSRNRVRN